MSQETAAKRRLISLDQFRGYTVAGMFLVNFVGAYEAVKLHTPVLKHHNTYCSYADTIMPQFLFAVGFAFRLTIGRRIERDGLGAVGWRVVRRMLGLALVAIAVYTDGRFFSSWNDLASSFHSVDPSKPAKIWTVLESCLKREWFQTLMHIAVTSLWILPVIGASAGARIGYMLFSAVLHVVLSWQFNFVWVNTAPNGIDGGPLGILTWAIPALVGSLACDAVVDALDRPPIGKMLAWSAILMLLGYAFSCGTRLYDVDDSALTSDPASQKQFAADPVLPRADRLQGRSFGSLLAEPPFIGPPPDPTKKSGSSSGPFRQWNYWMMSQRAGSISYLVFSAGFSLAVYVLFWWACDKHGFELPVFRTLGVNALAGYVLYGPVATATKVFMADGRPPNHAPLWFVMGGFAVCFAWLWLILRHFEKQGVFIRV